MKDLFLYDVSDGVLTQLWAGTSREGATLNGKVFIPFDVPSRKYRCTKRITDSSIWFLGLELVQLVRTVRLQKLERNCGRGWRSRSSTFKTIPTVLSWLASHLNMYRRS